MKLSLRRLKSGASFGILNELIANPFDSRHVGKREDAYHAGS